MEGACYGSIDQIEDKCHPVQRVKLPEYWIDRSEVTNTPYAAFLEETHYLPRDLTNFRRSLAALGWLGARARNLVGAAW